MSSRQFFNRTFNENQLKEREKTARLHLVSSMKLRKDQMVKTLIWGEKKFNMCLIKTNKLSTLKNICIIFVYVRQQWKRNIENEVRRFEHKTSFYCRSKTIFNTKLMKNFLSFDSFKFYLELGEFRKFFKFNCFTLVSSSCRSLKNAKQLLSLFKLFTKRKRCKQNSARLMIRTVTGTSCMKKHF